jgi:hypothetical protein
VFTAHGLPSSLYTDRGSHYFYTAKAGEAVDRERLTQVGRALDRLGIEHIAAYSPEARGRSERMFGTLQDRLIKELAKAVLTEALCIQEDRVVDRVNTVSWGRLRLQLPQSPLRAHFVKARVRVHEYPDGAPGGVPRPTLYRALQRAGRGDIRGSDLRKRDTVLAAVKAWPVQDRACGKRSATAILDCGCARRHWADAGRDMA